MKFSTYFSTLNFFILSNKTLVKGDREDIIQKIPIVLQILFDKYFKVIKQYFYLQHSIVSNLSNSFYSTDSILMKFNT